MDDISDISERLNALIAKAGAKHWSFALRRDTDLLNAINAATPDLEGEPVPVRAYAAATRTRPACPEGNTRPLKSITAGWGFCGKTGVCACARASVSRSVIASKAQATEEDIAATSARRAKTNLARYGVTNTGQTQAARDRHAAVYADASRVAEAVAKGRETMIARHGVDNALKLPVVNALRPTIAASLTPEKKRAAAAKRVAKAKAGSLVRASFSKLMAEITTMGFTWLMTEENYRGVMDTREFRFICGRCQTEFPDYLADGHRPTCPDCDRAEPSYVSGEEAQVADFLEGLGFTVKRTVRHLLPRMELDIYLPEVKIAVEYCGLYWHSEFARGRGRTYHRDKMRACAERGIRLVTVFSDEWIDRRGACERRLRHLLGHAETKIGARETVCRPITGHEANVFFETHHVQGDVKSASLRYGLFKGDDLVAAMTFGRVRTGQGHLAKPQWELYRFASRDSVVGAASKLFTRFVRDQDPDTVLSYADNRWGHGGVYERLGFVLDGHTDPGYWWVEGYRYRHHRTSFTKKSLVAAGYDAALSETEIMRARRFDRIWDCGNARFLWHKS